MKLEISSKRFELIESLIHVYAPDIELEASDRGNTEALHENFALLIADMTRSYFKEMTIAYDHGIHTIKDWDNFKKEHPEYDPYALPNKENIS